jgi:hypothetical protein
MRPLPCHSRAAGDDGHFNSGLRLLGVDPNSTRSVTTYRYAMIFNLFYLHKHAILRKSAIDTKACTINDEGQVTTHSHSKVPEFRRLSRQLVVQK